MKIRFNFKSRFTSVSEDEDGIFYKFGYDADGSSSIDVVCDTYTGISVEVVQYGEVGDWIVGKFSATNCDGIANANSASGSFSVIREE